MGRGITKPPNWFRANCANPVLIRVGLGQFRRQGVWAGSGRPSGKHGLAQKGPKLSLKNCYFCLSNHKISLISFKGAVNPGTCVITKLVICWEIFSLAFLITPFHPSRVAGLWFFTSHLCQGFSFKIWDCHKLWNWTIDPTSIMSDLQDNISELSSLSSYPSSPGASSQIFLDTPTTFHRFALTIMIQ